jgi:hypothetical protein
LFVCSRLVQSIAWHGVVHAKYNSCLGRNGLFCCKLFGWPVDDFVLNIFQPANEFFAQYFMDGLSQDTVSSGMML